jgi:two-component system sensor histidine kinase YesM
MLLHTLVENAVKHGVAQVRGAGRIEIYAQGDADTLILEVRDNGPFDSLALAQDRPFDPSRQARPEGEHFGLRSIHDRLRGHFGDRATLSLTRDAANGLTVARVEMPLVRTQEQRDTSILGRR